MTVKTRLGRLEAAWRRRPVEELSFNLDAISYDDVRWVLDNFEKDTESLTDDERARAQAISKAMIVTLGGRRCEWRNTGEFDMRGGEWQVSKDG